MLGALLLTLPVATIDRETLGFVDALFTATSAVCVTGLTVVNTGVTFSLFGQVVIILLIQVGGLGFMTMASLVFLAIGRRIPCGNGLSSRNPSMRILSRGWCGWCATPSSSPW